MNPKIDGVYIGGYGWCRRVPGTAVTKAAVIAGKEKAPFRDAPFYAARYGGNFDDWRKMRGEMVVDCGGTPTRIEAHWVQGVSVDPIDVKFVRRFK